VVDKHHDLIQVGIAHHSVNLDLSVGAKRFQSDTGFEWVKDLPAVPIGIRPANRQFPLIDGTILFRIPAGVSELDVDTNPTFTLDITFAPDTVTQGETVIPSLGSWIREIETIIHGFDHLDRKGGAGV
jgi:hypothetical protein